MKRNCDIIRDLIPMHIEGLASEESNQFIKEHLHSCKDCANYYKSIERDLPDHDVIDANEEKDDQQLVQGIQRKLKISKFMAIVTGALIGIAVSAMYFNIALVSMLICIFAVLYFMNSEEKGNAGNRKTNIGIFILSFTALIISLKLFWNTAIYVDEYGADPVAVYGGEFWLYMAWLRLPLLAIVTIISGFKLFSR